MHVAVCIHIFLRNLSFFVDFSLIVRFELLAKLTYKFKAAFLEQIYLYFVVWLVRICIVILPPQGKAHFSILLLISDVRERIS